ncbi:MAG TPA: fimbria/pilus outer membrane usher protein [Burkholderiales bacterium]|nr:fimbria/pilus outer membrane usher protein [Burkholderiales bacterium]
MRGTLSLLALAASAGLAMPDATAQTSREGVQVMPAEAESAAAPDAEPATRIIPLEVSVNGARAGSWVLMERAGTLYAQLDAFEEWRINRDPRAPAVVYRGETWYPLGSLPGYSARFNPAEQSLQLNFSAAAFATTRLGQPEAERPVVTRPLTTVFANYDLSYTHSDLRGLSSTDDVGALTELGISGSAGVLTNTSVIRNIASDPGAPYSPGWRRLETTFTRDYPERNASLRLGDSTTRTGAWGRSVYFGGIQWGTNFSLSPGYITQPIPTITGQSRAPSTVELYINDALRQTSQVPTGPFTIDNFPQITGSGQARIVVRDLLGRETVLVQDFFSSASLLRKGLSDYSFEAGAVRRNLGIDSANYGAGFVSGLWRHGFTNDFTLETRAEASEQLRGGGAGVAVALPFGLLGQVAGAASSDDLSGSGREGLVSLEHWSLRHGFTLRAEAASREYRQVGQDEGSLSYRRQWLASYTYATPQLGHFGLGYGKIDTYDRGPITTYSANYSILVFERSSITVSATRVEGGDASGRSIGVSLLIPLDGRINSSAATTHHAGHTDGYASVSKGLGIEAGPAWRALAGQRTGQNYVEGGLYYQGSRGLVTADASASDTQSTVRLGAQGGLVFADGALFASRKVQDSFALVEVPGYPDVGVGFQSSVLSRTDSNGRALVPQLQPYRTNTIRLDPNELPINAELDNIEMAVVPPARSGVKVTFPVRSGRGALVRIVLDDGQPAPAGAELELVGDTKEFFVARRGEAFVTGLKDKNRLRVKWEGRSCEFDVELPPGKPDDIARVGPYVCSGVTR